VNIARLLWGFNLTLAKDSDGNIIPVDFTTKGLSPGFLSNPKPFKCCIYLSSPCLLTAITPRSPAHERILREEWEEAKKTGLQFETSQIEKLVPK